MIILFTEEDVRLSKIKQLIDKELSVDLVKNKIYAVFFSSDKTIAYTVLAEDLSIP